MPNKVVSKLLNTNELNVPFLIWSILFAIFINIFSNILRTQFHNPVISLFSFHLIMTFLKLVSSVC